MDNYLIKDSKNEETGMKANALLCPYCCVEYEEVNFDFEVYGIILQNVKALKCPSCNDEVFTPRQIEKIMKRASLLSPRR
jgi:hypothetical protein